MLRRIFAAALVLLLGGGALAQEPPIYSVTPPINDDSTRIATTHWVNEQGATGSVTSVGLSAPAGIFGVTGSPVTGIGTLGLTVTGTSGGVPYFSSGSTLGSSAVLSLNLPVIGGGVGGPPSSGSVSGNTTEFATVSGALTATHVAAFDASGNIVDGGASGAYAAPTLGSTLIPSGTTIPAIAGLSGLSVIVTNPQLGSDPNDRRAVDFTCSTYSSTSNPGFTDENCVQITETAFQGQNSYGGGTNAKTTFLPLLITGNMYGAGQRFLLGETQNCYGMGDCFDETRVVQFAGADINGDEGQGYQSVSYLRQQPNLTLTTIAAPPVRTSCNTTATQNITASATAQAVTVASTTGCNVNDWVEVQAEAPTASPNHEGVQITAVGSGTLTGVFRNNHSSGVTITPALVLTVSNGYQFGQGRVLVDLSGSSYSTGTVSSISGGGFVGSGTTWAANMVGGASPNIGCISLTADDYASAPFNGSGVNGKLKSWYQILAVTNATHLGIYKTSAAGDAGYNGNGPGAGGYISRPCAEVLYVNSSTVVLETSAATWTNGDSVELSISPYPDVTGYQNDISAYTPGGALRGYQSLINTGARTFQTAYRISANMPTGADVDPVGWGTVFYASGMNIGSNYVGAKWAPIVLDASTPNASAVYWGAINGGVLSNQYINEGTLGFLIHGGSGTTGAADSGSLGWSSSTGRNWVNLNSNLSINYASGGTNPHLRFSNANTGGDPTTATRFVDSIYTYPGATIPNPISSGETGILFSSTNEDFTNGTEFVIGERGAGVTSIGAATSNTTNVASNKIYWQDSVWNGSAAAGYTAQAWMVPGSGSNNAHSIWTLAMPGPDSGGGYHTSFPNTVFGVRDDGQLSFGVNNAGYGPTILATLDPTGITANRTLTVPDKSGTFAMTSDLYAAPTLGGTLISSGATVTSIASLTLSAATLSGSLTGLPTPVNPSDAASKSYVDALSTSIVVHASVAASTTGNLNATYANGASGVGATLTNAGTQAAFSTDGYSGLVDDRILVLSQTTAAQNGIYTLTTVGTGATNWVLTRAVDFNTAMAGNVATGALVAIVNGTANAHTLWLETGQGPFTVGTTPIVWSEVIGASGGVVNSGTTNQLGYYASSGTAISGLATANSGVLVTSAGGVPSISTTLPSGIAATNMALTTPAIGVATGASLSVTGQLTSTVSTGTPPLVVSSTTQVANLNAATAGTVTTNANLTGVITSVGNATSIASQTGTGSKFVVDTSPSLITPNLGTPSVLVLTSATGLPVSTGITGLGTGVATALAVNIGSAGAPVLFNGAGGTPSSLVATNLTGTAASLTAGHVTTNANLTGVITSVGNATSIASQTGTGSKFVVDTSPTLVTPVLGVATGTSLSLSGGLLIGGASPFTGSTIVSQSSQLSPTGIYATFRQLSAGLGNNTTFVGVSGGFLSSLDDASVVTGTKGVLYGLQLSVRPLLTRNNTPFDDATGLVVQNDSPNTSKATDGLYVGHNSGFTAGAAEWITSFTSDANSSYGIRLNGTIGLYGVDLESATLGRSAFFGPNNIPLLGGVRAGGGADVEIARVNASNAVALANQTITVNPLTGATILLGAIPSTSISTGSLTITGATGGLGVAGNGQFGGTIRSTGFDSGGTSTAGPGAELRYDGTNASLLGYNRTSSIYIPVLVNGSVVKLLDGASNSIGVSDGSGNFAFAHNLTTNITGSTQCVHANSAGLLSGTGADCVAKDTVSTAVSGAGNNSQGSATQLTSVYNEVTVVGPTTNGVKCPVPVAGIQCKGVNAGANPLNVFGTTGVQIGAAGVNVAAQVAPGAVWIIEWTTTTQGYLK